MPERTLERRMHELMARYPGEEVPRPPHWGGYRVVPDVIEFWQGRPNRLHDRLRYRRLQQGGWRIERSRISMARRSRDISSPSSFSTGFGSAIGAGSTPVKAKTSAEADAGWLGSGAAERGSSPASGGGCRASKRDELDFACQGGSISAAPNLAPCM